MKTGKMKLFVLAMAIMMFPALSFAQPMLEGAFISKVTVKLKSDQTVQVLNAKDEDGKTIKPKELVWDNEWITDKGEFFEAKGKFQTTKIGNKEILEAVEDAGIIDTIKGAQIVLIIDEGIFLAVEEKNGNIIDISGVLGLSQNGPEVFEFDVQEEDTVKNGEKASLSGTLKLPIMVTFAFGDIQSIVYGIIELSGSGSFSEKKQKETMSFDGGKIAPLSGFLVDINSDNGTECFEDDCYGIVEGTIDFGKGKELEMQMAR